MSLLHLHHYRIISANDMRRTYNKVLTTDDIFLVAMGKDVKRSRSELYTAVVQQCTDCKKLKFYEIPGSHAKALLVGRYQEKVEPKATNE